MIGINITFDILDDESVNQECVYFKHTFAETDDLMRLSKEISKAVDNVIKNFEEENNNEI